MQGALILGLTASCIVSSVAGQPNPDLNAIAIAHNSPIHGSDSECGGTYPLPPDTHVADMPICSQVKAIEERYCALRHPVDDPTALELHRLCLCATPFFDMKSKCHKCITAKGDLTPGQDFFFDAVIRKAKEQFCDITRVNTEPFSKVWLKLVDSTKVKIEESPAISEHSEHPAAPHHTVAHEHTAAAVGLAEANTDTTVCCENYFTPEEMDKALLQLAEAPEEEDTPDDDIADEDTEKDDTLDKATEEDDTPKSIALLPGGQTLNMTNATAKRSLHGKRSRCVGGECLYCTKTTEEEKTVVNMELSKKFPADCCKGDYKQCTKSTVGGTTVDVRVLKNGTIISKIFWYNDDPTKVTTGSSAMTSSSALVLFGCALMGMLATLL